MLPGGKQQRLASFRVLSSSISVWKRLCWAVTVSLPAPTPPTAAAASFAFFVGIVNGYQKMKRFFVSNIDSRIRKRNGIQRNQPQFPLRLQKISYHL